MSEKRSVPGRVHQHIRSNVVGYIALFVALSGTAYAASIGPNDIQDNAIRSRHIKDGQVRTQDVANDTTTHALTGTNIANGGLTGADVANGSLTGNEIQDGSLTGADVQGNSLTGNDIADGSLNGADVQGNSLTGSDINESTLGEVPVAQIGGYGRYTGNGSCDPGSTSYLDCAITTINLPTAARVLLIGQADGINDGTQDFAGGTCKLVTNTGDVANTSTTFFPGNAGVRDSGSMAGITGVLGAGSHDFAVDCNQFPANGIKYDGVGITAVAISSN